MDRETSLVPVKALEGLAIDSTRRLTEGDKKSLLKILEAKIHENRAMLRGIIGDVKERVLEQARQAANLSRYTLRIEELQARKAALDLQIDAVQSRCANTTGFDTNGKLLDSESSSYDYGAKKEYYSRHKVGIQKALALAKRQEQAAEGYERYAIKFDKVQTRLVLASTYAEAMAIMDAVLGNGDSILKAKAGEQVEG